LSVHERKKKERFTCGLSRNVPRVSELSRGWHCRRRCDMRPQSCKAKGRRFQQKVVADLLRTFAHLAPDDVVSTSMGAGGEDIRLSKRARDAIPLSFEIGRASGRERV